MRPDPFFAGPGLDRADLLRAQPAELDRLAASPAARELIWKDDLPAVGSDGRLLWKAVAQPALFLGLENDLPRFSSLQPQVAEPRAALSLLPNLCRQDAPLFSAALSLARWHSRHGFCAGCGHSTEAVRGGWSRRCLTCGEHYPRVDPVVIVLAEHEGRLLLGRQHHYPPKRYSALAGFVEVGETIEDAAARELHEEAGIRIADVEYIASQPWPFPSSLMVGCTARALSADLTIDHTELDDARWFTRNEVAAAVAGEPDAPFEPPPPHAIARTLLDQWLAA